jgi:hypothetical protein
VEDAMLRRRLGRAARRDVETKFNVARWNEGLKEALGRALPPAESFCDETLESRVA